MTEAEFLSQVEHLLIEVTSAQDTAVLKRATKDLHDNFYKSDLCIPVLVHILQNSQNTAVRQLAAVEAKKLVPKFWSESFAPQIRSSLLQSALAEPDAKTRHASARLISAIGRIYMKNGTWPELPLFCEQASISPRASDREIGLYIIYSIFETEPEFFETRRSDLLRLFSHTIHDQESRQVRQSTLLCLGELSARIYEKDKALYSLMLFVANFRIKGFRDVLPAMTVVVQQAIEAGDEQDARDAFEVFEGLLVVESALLSKNLRDVLEFFVSIAANSDVDPVYREMALSFLAIAIRYKRQRIQTLKLGADLMLSMVRIAAEPEEESDPDEDTPVKIAIVNISILATSLPPTHVLPQFLENFPTLAGSSNPYERRAAMSALGAVMEGSLEFMADCVDQFLPLVFNALQDPKAIVVRAALNALSQITTELGDDVVQPHHSTMIPVVFDLLSSRDPKIMKAACNTLDALLEWVPQDSIVGYLPKLMEALLFIMTTHVDSAVKIIVVSAIGAAAHSSKEAFFPYLDSTVKTLFSIQNLTSEENYDLRACVTDTLGTTASAVRKEKFLPYMDQSFQLALDGLKTGHSRLRESAFCFFAGMADVLKEGLNPVLDQIVPALFETLDQEDIDFGDKITEEDAKALLNGDVTDDMSDDDDESIEVKVNSALQLEKEIAADALREIFVNVKSAFLPYLAKATTRLVELADTFYDGARKSALSALWAFVVTLGELQVTEPWVPGLPVGVPLPSDVVELTTVVRNRTMEVLKEESEREVMAEIFRSISDALIALGPGILGADGQTLAAITLVVLRREHPCQHEDDEEDLQSFDDEDMAEIETQLIDGAVDLVIAFAKTLQNQFAQEFDPFYARLIKLSKSKTGTERSMAVAALGEITKALKGGMTKYTGELLSTFLACVDDDSIEVASNTVYGLGLVLENTTEDLSGQYANILTKLQRFFSTDAPRNAKDNAIGCVSRMIIRHPNAVPLDLVLPAIVAALPLKDFIENEPTYQMIIQLYQANNHVMLSLTEQLLPALAQVLAEDEGKEEQISMAMRLRLLELVKALRQEYPQLF